MVPGMPRPLGPGRALPRPRGGTVAGRNPEAGGRGAGSAPRSPADRPDTPDERPHPGAGPALGRGQERRELHRLATGCPVGGSDLGASRLLSALGRLGPLTRRLAARAHRWGRTRAGGAPGGAGAGGDPAGRSQNPPRHRCGAQRPRGPGQAAGSPALPSPDARPEPSGARAGSRRDGGRDEAGAASSRAAPAPRGAPTRRLASPARALDPASQRSHRTCLQWHSHLCDE